MAAQSFRLGVDFSQPIGDSSLFVTNAVATDAQGDIYGLASIGFPTPQSYLVKLTPAGAVVYQTTLPFYAPFMAADATGNVYLAGIRMGPAPLWRSWEQTAQRSFIKLRLACRCQPVSPLIRAGVYMSPASRL
jgi:hypothetical protein